MPLINEIVSTLIQLAIALAIPFVADLLQVVIFGLLHPLLVGTLLDLAGSAAAFVFSLSTFAGWLPGYIKIRHAGGSIVPGWFAHAPANGATYGWVWLAL